MTTIGTNTVLCGECGASMVTREIAPCLDCGGDPKELDDLKSGEHWYARVQLFDGEVLCDFCQADMPSTDSLYWGFPTGFSWDRSLDSSEIERISNPQSQAELACPNCHNTLRRQLFAQKNAHRNQVHLPNKYWPYLEDREPT